MATPGSFEDIAYDLGTENDMPMSDAALSIENAEDLLLQFIAAADGMRHGLGLSLFELGRGNRRAHAEDGQAHDRSPFNPEARSRGTGTAIVAES
jgi:hypothetical protein